MAGCLGLYIQDNLIKYAKVFKDANNIKVESFGITFYEDLPSTINKIMRETYSYQIPITVNIENVNYTYSSIFSLLSKKDFKEAENLQFDSFCAEHAKNIKAVDYKTIENADLGDSDKTRIIYSYTDKANTVERASMLSQYKIGAISPVALTISNLLDSNENSVIVNIENKTEITTIVKGKTYKIDKIDEGMESILQRIAVKENSQAKAYEICKNTTIYTTSTQNLQTEENIYLEEIMPTLFSIIQKVKDIIAKNAIEVEKVYISGLAMAINNVDLFFQENLLNQKCEILLPYFIDKTSIRANIKDYIEVNSAISLGLQGVNGTNKEFNMQREKFDINELLHRNINTKSKNILKKEKISFKDLFKSDLKTELDIFEKALFRFIAAGFMVLILYIALSYITSQRLNSRLDSANNVIKDTNQKVTQIGEYAQRAQSKSSNYQSAIDEITALKNEVSIGYAVAIPNLLINIMTAMPKEVQILSISTTSTGTVTIEAQANQYEYLGYFKAKLTNDSILDNVSATTGTKVNGYIKVTITGTLPNY